MNGWTCYHPHHDTTRCTRGKHYAPREWAQSFCVRVDENDAHDRHSYQHGPDDWRECPGWPLPSTET